MVRVKRCPVCKKFKTTDGDIYRDVTAFEMLILILAVFDGKAKEDEEICLDCKEVKGEELHRCV